VRKLLIGLFLAIIFIFSGCSYRPALTAGEEGSYHDCEALILQAGADIEAAKAAGAEVFAKDSLNLAAVSLENAKVSLAQKDFSKAKENALRASAEAKRALNEQQSAKQGIIETEKQIASAKEAKIDDESPSAFRVAVDQLEAAKNAYNLNDFPLVNICVYKSALALKRANEEPVAAKNAVSAAEEDIITANELKIEAISPDSYKAASEAYDLSKLSLESKNNVAAIESAGKASKLLKTEIIKAVYLYIEQAKTDLAAAREAGASEFAADKLSIAEEYMASVNSLLEKGQFLNAKNSAEKVAIAAKEAEIKAKAGKEAKLIRTSVAAALETPDNSSNETEMPANKAVVEKIQTKKPAVSAQDNNNETVKNVNVEIAKGDVPLITVKAKVKDGYNIFIITGIVVVIIIIAVFMIRFIRKIVTKSNTLPV